MMRADREFTGRRWVGEARIRHWLAASAGLFGSATLAWAQLTPPPVSPAPQTRFEYDARGLQTARILAPGSANHEATARRSYDGLARLRAEVDPLGAAVGLAYDGREGPLELRDPRQLVTTWFRDGVGRARHLLSPDTGATAYTTDAAGNPITSTDARGATVRREFDALNRIVSAQYQLPGASALSLTWRYDETGVDFGHGIGRLTTQAFPGGSQRYAYDALGRIVRMTQTVSLAADSPTISRQVQYAYDASGRVTSITYPSGRTVHYRMEAGLVSAIEWSVGSSARAALLTGIRHEPFGAPRSWYWQHSIGTVLHAREFDTAGRFTRYPLGSVVRDLRYDPAGRIESYTHLDRFSGTATAGAQALDQSFAYDGADRIVRVAAAGTTWAFSYDPSGNRVSAQVGTVTRPITVDTGSNRLLAQANPTRSFAYDAIGSVVADTQAPAQWTGTYDARGRLVRTRSTGDGSRFVETAYLYDANERRVGKVELSRQICNRVGQFTACTNMPSAGLAQVEFVYGTDGLLLGEYSPNEHTEYIWLGTTPVAVLRASAPGWQPQTFYIHADHLDAPRIVTDTLGRLRWSWLAEPFGHMLPNENPQGLGRFAFNPRMPGQYYDAETGLFQNHHRDYDASLGRYTQSDPIGLAGGINTYVYAEGNPVSLTDPLGLATYMCTQPLHALGAAGRTVYSPSSNPLYHQFIGIIRPDGSVITGGQDRAGGPWGPGKPSEGDGAPGSGAECKKVEDDYECLERCLMGKFAAPRPRYSLALQGLTGGQNCQGWADSTLAQCQASCKGKR